MPELPNTEGVDIDLDAVADAALDTPEGFTTPEEVQEALVEAQLSVAESAERIADALEELVKIAKEWSKA